MSRSDRPTTAAWCAAAVLFVLPAGAAQGGSHDEDLQKVEGRLVADLLERPGPTRAELGVRLTVLDGDGSWPDIDYRDQRRSAWAPPQHLRRLLDLAVAYRKPGQRSCGDAAVLTAARSALDYWLEHDFRNANWWWNRIGVPRRLYGTLLLLQAELDASELERGSAILARGKLGMTGQNRVWLADITLARACLLGDAALAAKAVASVGSTLSVGGKEGIQADLAFFQHGRCLYSGGYGLAFSVDTARMAALVRGTAFAFAPEQVDLLRRYVLDGQRWMMRGAVFDWGTVGREISRRGKSGAAIAGACRDLAKLGPARRAELEAMARRVKGQPRAGDPVLEGNRYFYRGELMAHRRKGFLVTVRTCSERVDNTDNPCNREGLLSHHLADGVTLIYRDGGEYRDLFGAWDWQRIPGATIERCGLEGSPRRHGRGSLAGGVSDGACGVAAFDLTVGALTAHKAWFCFDDEVLCLAAGVSCGSEHPVVTAVDQCRLRGVVTAASGSGGAVSLGRGEHDLAGTRWVQHAGVGYVFGPGCRPRLELAARTSDWHRINERYHEGGRQVDVFDLWLDHGVGPRDGNCAYWLLPDVSADELARRAGHLDTVVLSNQPDLQAAWHRPTARLGVAFRRAGALLVPADLLGGTGRPLRIAVDGPALLLLRFGPKAVTVCSADPNARGSKLALEIGLPLGAPFAFDAGRGASTCALALPGHRRRGATLTLRARRGSGG